ncbi:hypothetical protein FB451DRAFT_1558182 [Mycena latifolia]|nr:hypothetical protein FB451DRAFT_1558182 [Mycena latifolia]
MHRALRIPEIVYLIFAEIKRPFRREGHELRVFRTDNEHPALAALSQTCTTFRDPALDLLWSEQSTLLHFLNTFPRDLIKKVQDERSVHLLRPVCPKDWERPLLYSRHIKLLLLISPASSIAFETLSLSCPGGYMLPNLQLLDLSDLPQSASSIDFLLSPQLQEIRLHFYTGFRLLCQIVPTLAVKCPSLICLCIYMDKSYDAATLKVVSDFVRSLVRIQELGVTSLDQDAFKHLGGLTSLTVLRLEDPKVPWTSALPIDAATSPQHMYSSLAALYFGETTTVDRITAFINIISNAQLKKLQFELLDDPGPSDAIGRLYSALTTHCSHDSLQDISMRGAWPSLSASMDQYRIHGATLRTLFCFVNMVSVELHQCSGFDLDDADIFDMACAWPRLESLSLTGFSDLSPEQPRVTLQGLYAFAQHCPSLQYLGMNFNATVPLELPVRSLSSVSLELLDVWYSPIRTPSAVAAFLTNIYPQADIELFDVHHPTGTDYEELENLDRWAEVKQSLKDLRAQKIFDKGGVKVN